MTRKQHGVLSLLLFLMGMLAGAASICLSSRLLTAVYLGAALVLSLLLFFSYCSKCSCRNHSCAHVLPGKLTELLPKRAEAPYDFLDYLGAALPILFILVFSQYWLIRNVQLLIAFWALVGPALLEIYFCLCNGCQNIHCAARHNIQRIDF